MSSLPQQGGEIQPELQAGIEKWEKGNKNLLLLFSDTLTPYKIFLILWSTQINKYVSESNYLGRFISLFCQGIPINLMGIPWQNKTINLPKLLLSET